MTAELKDKLETVQEGFGQLMEDICLGIVRTEHGLAHESMAEIALRSNEEVEQLRRVIQTLFEELPDGRMLAINDFEIVREIFEWCGRFPGYFLSRLRLNEHGRATEANFTSLNREQYGSLTGLSKLSSLVITNYHFEDLSAVSPLKQLTELALGNSSLKTLSGVDALENLQKLAFRSRNAVDLEQLSQLKSLTSLCITGCSGTHLSVLSRCPQLQELTLMYNQIPDLSSLTGARSVNSLNVIGNPLTDISELALFHSLRSFKFTLAEGLDLAPLLALPKGAGIVMDVNGSSGQVDMKIRDGLKARGCSVTVTGGGPL